MQEAFRWGSGFGVSSRRFRSDDPTEFSFEFTSTVGWIILLYWSGDVVMSRDPGSNLVGFYEQGELIMNQRRIVFRYLRTWFLIDLLVLGPDWFLRVLATTGEAGDLRMVNETSADEGEMEDVANALRSLRVLRVVRLLRLLKVQRLMNLVYDILDSEYIFILFTLLKLTCLITVMNHVIACMWYGVGYMTMQNGELNWLENSGANASRVIDGSMMYQYTTALHWSLTQFTPASMDSVARNVPERIVSIVVVFFALIGFSSIVGSVTNSVAQLQALHGNSRRQFWLLRKYLNEKGIWNPTRARLFAFLEHEVERRRQDVKAEDVRLLQLLSSPLQNLLAYELHRGPMKGHPFFGLLEAEMQPVMYQVCHKALRFRHYAAEDTCFTEAEGGKFMWLITEGTFTYIKGGQRHTLSQGAWLAEPVLWTSWWHRGQLEGKSTSGEPGANGGGIQPP
ncbi:unnamed protein product [Effrenium voratum]|nr:unnamed protein product [Effrenium voratum]